MIEVIEVKVKDRIVFIDAEDLDKFNKYKWYISPQGYCFSKNGILLHRLVLEATNGEFVDHINHNKLDNRKENLRKCTHQENMRNRKISKSNKSGFKGVYFEKWAWGKKHWRASMRVDNKNIHLGYFSSKEDAAIAYQEKTREIYGEFYNPQIGKIKPPPPPGNKNLSTAPLLTTSRQAVY